MGSRSRVLRACYSFLIPVARFLLRSGVSYREFADAARVAFVEVASADYGIRGRPTNLSRVSALTGISRKEVSRIRALEKRPEEQLHFNPLADVLHRWHTDPEFANDSGQPKCLSMEGHGSFTELVKRSTGDLPPSVIKKELIRCGAAEEDADGALSPARRYLVPPNREDNLVYRLSQAMTGLATTIAFNADFENPSRDDGRIERVVFTDKVPPETLKTLIPVIRQRVTDFTENLDDLFSSVESDDIRTKRIGVGVYYFEDSD